MDWYGSCPKVVIATTGLGHHQFPSFFSFDASCKKPQASHTPLMRRPSEKFPLCTALGQPLSQNSAIVPAGVPRTGFSSPPTFHETLRNAGPSTLRAKNLLGTFRNVRLSNGRNDIQKAQSFPLTPLEAAEQDTECAPKSELFVA